MTDNSCALGSPAGGVAAYSRLLAFGLAAGVFLFDRLTKLAVQAWVAEWDTLTVIPGFCNLIHTENPGAAFSLFAGQASEWRSFLLIVISGGASLLIAALLWRPGRLGEGRLARTGLSLILGGAAGNLCDRIFRGAVTDFLELYAGEFHWPAFNAADSAITIGAALILLEMLRSHRAARKA